MPQCIAFEEAPPDRKSIMASRSFCRMVETREELEEAVATFTARAAEKLRRQALAASRLMVCALPIAFGRNSLRMAPRPALN